MSNHKKTGQKKEGASLGRRNFFRTAGLGAGAVGAAAVGLAAEGSAAEPARKSPSSAGYRETGHVKKFYELARF
ncbi:MAG: formate dehydrogenase [Kiloniellales bacterium]